MINTKSSFIYGYTINETNYSLDFNEGAGELQASLNQGAYTFTELGNEIARAMNAVGGQEYTVSTDRDNRTYTISASSNFDLLAATGTRTGVGVWSTIGFSADQTGSNTYNSETSTGVEFRPQFKLQDYVDFEDNQGAQDASVNISSANVIEVISFGNEKFMECNISFQNNYNQGRSEFIENDPQGIENLREFMKFAITKGKMEFLPDRDNRNQFNKVILEKTATSSTGTAFKLRELYGRDLAGYFESGRLTFREVT
jgi:hypothetical protein